MAGIGLTMTVVGRALAARVDSAEQEEPDAG
jgi:hypothetical protein